MNISGACVQSKSKAVNKISTFNLVTHTVYPKKYAHGFCFAVLCCCYTLTDFPISIRLTSLAMWQSNDCPSASKATLMNMDKYFIWIHYERLHNHNKAKHYKTVCIFLGIYCMCTTKIVDIYLTIVYATVYSDADLRNSIAPRHWPLCPVNSPHKCPVTRKMVRFDDVIMHMCENVIHVVWYLRNESMAPVMTRGLPQKARDFYQTYLNDE